VLCTTVYALFYCGNNEGNVIIMINGPFGVGKTTIAQTLCSAIPESMLYDPEIVGTALRYFTAGVLSPTEQTDDFQDIALWPSLTVLIAEQLLNQYHKHLIVPMTIVHPDYFHTIFSGFQRLTSHLFHFCLLAPLSAIQERLRQRGDDSTSWAWKRSVDYLPRFADYRFQHHIQTHQRTPEEITMEILSVIGR
jgi:hypothetical protein